MLANLPALQVVIPLIAAPLCVLIRHRAIVWGFTLLVCWSTLVVAGLLLSQVLTTGPLSYALGDWAAPWGIEYRVDVLNGFLLLIVSSISAIVMPFARESVTKDIPENQIPLFYAAFLLCLTGLLGIVITGDAFNLFVFLEISSLSSYVLISLGKDRRALTAAYQYLIMGSIGATFFVIGVGLLYMMTGTLNMADLGARLPKVLHTRTVLAAFGFLTVGIGLKLAMFPLHLWLPNAYTYAPSVVTVFLAATATKVAVYVFVRFFFTIFGVPFVFETLPVGTILLTLGLAGVLGASTVAIFQTNVKRLLAYSSVAQIGYMLLGIGMASVTGLTAGILHLFNHAIMKGGLFMVMGCVMYQIGSVNIQQLNGIGKRMPWTMAAFVVGGLGLIGVPLTVGFMSKWYLVLGAIEKGYWLVVAGILLGSLLALVYIWRVVEVAYFRPTPQESPSVQEAPLSMLIPTWILIGTTLYFGVETSLTIGTADQAARFLMERSP
ncbi:MAG: monovalent cation/H+ antiporter subunit D family protein [Nitrospirota bacterium]|nr:MAG: monovalent cation/H+ antiporter subunit D family protein [Nitrospirota bacterium]